MLNKALSYCLVEEDPLSYAQILETLQIYSQEDELRNYQDQKQAFLDHVRNPKQSLEDHQNGIKISDIQLNKPSDPNSFIEFMDCYNQEEQIYNPHITSYSQLRQLQKSQQILKQPELYTFNPSSIQVEVCSTRNQSRVSGKKKFISQEKIDRGDQSPYDNRWTRNVLHKYYNVRLTSATVRSSSYSITTSASKPKCTPQSRQLKGRSVSFAGKEQTVKNYQFSQSSDQDINTELEILSKDRIQCFSNRSYVSRINSHLKEKSYNNKFQLNLTERQSAHKNQDTYQPQGIRNHFKKSLSNRYADYQPQEIEF